MKIKPFILAMVVVSAAAISTSCFSGGGKSDKKGKSNEVRRPTAVDLGLSVKWADRNMGAESPEKYGDFFAWGELKPKAEFTTSIWDGFDSSHLQERGVIDRESNLRLKHDAASQTLGGRWRMPTLSEIEELIDDCTWKWVSTYNGKSVSGYEVTGPNGKKIFLPAAGFKYGKNHTDAGAAGYYWSATAHPDEDLVYNMNFITGLNRWGSYPCYHGFSIRAVQ